jgi:surface protein
MLLRLYKKLFNFKVKFESLDPILSDDDFEPPKIDLGVHIANIQKKINLQILTKNVTDALEKEDQQKLKDVIENQWDGETAFYLANNDNIKKVVKFSIQALGNKANLNWIDVSCITNMSSLFANSQFNGDISNWNVSNVTSMECMFANSQFNGDISKWDVSNVTDMSDMFYKDFDFNGDISEWNISNVKDMRCLFAKTYSFDQDISKWKDKMKDVDTANMFLDARKHEGLFKS